MRFKVILFSDHQNEVWMITFMYLSFNWLNIAWETSETNKLRVLLCIWNWNWRLLYDCPVDKKRIVAASCSLGGIGSLMLVFSYIIFYLLKYFFKIFWSNSQIVFVIAFIFQLQFCQQCFIYSQALPPFKPRFHPGFSFLPWFSFFLK